MIRSAMKAGSWSRALRPWWPVGVFLVVAILASVVFAQFFDAKGHAADHLRSSQALFPMMAIYGVIVWATPRGHHNAVLWACGALLLVALVIVMVGNVRVVNAIGGQAWSDEEADALGSGRPGFTSGHDLATIGMFASVAATILLAIVLLVGKHVHRATAIVAVVLSLVFPPWIMPGAGILALALGVCLARASAARVFDPPVRG